MNCMWNMVCVIQLVLLPHILLAQNYSWEDESFYARFNQAGQSLASDFSEQLSEFEKHCGDTTSQEHCATTSSSLSQIAGVAERVNLMADWEWVKSRTGHQLSVIQSKKMQYGRMHQMSQNINWLGDPESEVEFTQYYNDFNRLSDLQLSYYELEDKENKFCSISNGTRYGVTRQYQKQCIKIKTAMGSLEESMNVIIQNSPLLATEPIQKLLQEENINKSLPIDEFIRSPLSQAARKAESYASSKYKSYYDIASGKYDGNFEKIKEIIHDPVLLIELGPQAEWISEVESDFDKSTLCRLSQRIYREKAASILWDFTKDIGTIATPWAMVSGAKAILGASKTIKLTKNGLKTTFFSSAVATTGVEVSRLQEELDRCDHTLENFQISASVNYDDVLECRDKKNQVALNTALVVVGEFFPLADKSEALFDPTKRLSRQKLRDMHEKTNYNAHQLKLWVDKKTFLKSPERKKYVESHSSFTEIGVKENRQFIQRVSGNQFEGKVVFAAEHSFLKHHNDVAPNDKAFATALNNDFKQTLYSNLQKELGDDAVKGAEKYSDYKNIIIVVDDTKENRKAIQRAYIKTKLHIRDTFNNELKLAKGVIESSARNTPTSDIDKIFNAGTASGSRAPDKALKLARENRKRHPEHGGGFNIKSENTKPDMTLIKARSEYGSDLRDSDYLRDYKDFKGLFDEQANNIEKQRKGVVDALLRSHPMNSTQTNKSQLLKDFEDSGLIIRENTSTENYVLSTEAIQVLRKANAPRIRGEVSSEAWGREIYLNKIQKKYKNRFGVRIEKEQLEDFIEYHHALDDFSPPFYTERRIDMSAKNAKADIIAIDREMAGAVNEQSVALQFAGRTMKNDDEALVLARTGVDKATGVLMDWRENIKSSVVKNLSVPGRIRLMGDSRFNSLPKIERDKILNGEYSDVAFEGIIKSSADDFLIMPENKMTETDLKQISRAVATSKEKNHTRVSIAQAYPDYAVNKLQRKIFRPKSTIGDLTQKQAEVGEDYAKRILDQVSLNSSRSHFKPNIQIKSSRTAYGTKKFKVIVRDNLTPEQKEVLQRSINETMGRGWGTPYGGVEFLSPQSNYFYKSPNPPPPGEWRTIWLWAGQFA